MKRFILSVLTVLCLVFCMSIAANAATETVTLHKINLSVDGSLQANNNATTVERLEDCIKITPTPTLATANKDANLNIHSLDGAGVPVSAIGNTQYITLKYKYELGTGVTQSATNMQLVLLTNGGALSSNVTLNSNEVPVPGGSDFATVRFDLGDISSKVNTSGTVNQMWLRVYGGSTKGTDIDASEIMYVGDICFMAEIESVDTVYVSGQGDDSKDGLTPENAVATLDKAHSLLTENGTVYVIGTVNGVDSNAVHFGISGKSVTYEGYTDETYTDTPTIKSRFWQRGDVTYKNITLENTTSGDYNAMRTNGFDLTIGDNVTIKDKNGGTNVAVSQMREAAYTPVDNVINIASGSYDYGVNMGSDWITVSGKEVLNVTGNAHIGSVHIGRGETGDTAFFKGEMLVNIGGNAKVDLVTTGTKHNNKRMSFAGLRYYTVSDNAEITAVSLTAPAADGFTRTGVTVLQIDGGSVGEITSSNASEVTSRAVIFNNGASPVAVEDTSAIVISVAEGGSANALTTLASDYSCTLDGFEITAPADKPYVLIDGVLATAEGGVYKITEAKASETEGAAGVYSVTFSGDITVTVDGNENVIAPGSELTLPDTAPVRAEDAEHYSFIGWSSDKDSEKLYTLSEKVTLYEDTVFIAQFAAKEYTVTIDGSENKVTYGTKLTLGQKPSELGEDYSFAWYDKTNLKQYEAGAEYTVSGDAEIVSATEYNGAKYIPEGYYNAATKKYTVNLYMENIKANTATFGFKYNTAVMTLDSFTHMYVPFGSVENDYVNDTENGIYIDRWIASEGEGIPYVDATEDRQLIGMFVFTMSDHSAFDPETDFVAAPWQDKAGAYENGSYLAIPHVVDYDTARVPIVIEALTEVSEEKVTVGGNVITVRENGKTPNSDALAKVTLTSGGEVVAEYLEATDTAVGTVSFSLEAYTGVYTLTVVKHGYITYEAEITVTADTTLPDITLIPGDIKGSTEAVCGDGKVDLSDFVRVVRGFDSASSTGYKKTVDIDESGAVSVTDLGYIKASFGKTAQDYNA